MSRYLINPSHAIFMILIDSIVIIISATCPPPCTYCLQLKKKVDKYYNQYPIPVEKYKSAAKLHTEANEKHQKAHENLLNVSVLVICVFNSHNLV